MRLVLIETASNQEFVFASNRLIEAVGGSEMIYRVGTEFVLKAIESLDGPQGLWSIDPAAMCRRLRDPRLNPAMESEAGRTFEVVNAASGKALVLCASFDDATRLIASVTRRALIDAPGLGVFGAISDEFDFDADRVDTVSDELHESGIGHARVEAIGSPTTRFPRHPIGASCATSGYPAAAMGFAGSPDAAPRSISSAMRSEAGRTWALGKFDSDGRLPYLLGDTDRIRFARNHDELERVLATDRSWVGVLHADTNSAGKVFSNVADVLIQAGALDSAAAIREQNRSIVDGLRDMSIELDQATRVALADAAFELKPTKVGRDDVIPLLPLIVGGDDFTAVVDGEQSLRFAQVYLRSFARSMRQSTGPLPALTSSVGLAVTKPHFPFAAGLRLAESLTSRCKTLLRDQAASASALDFHVLFDSTSSQLSEIEERLARDIVSEEPRSVAPKLRGGPFIVDADASDWQVARSFESLAQRAASLLERSKADDDRRVLSGAQMHRLREQVLRGPAAADRHFRRLVRATPEAKSLAMDSDSLFATNGATGMRTDVLDAMVIAELCAEPQVAAMTEVGGV